MTAAVYHLRKKSISLFSFSLARTAGFFVCPRKVTAAILFLLRLLSAIYFRR